MNGQTKYRIVVPGEVIVEDPAHYTIKGTGTIVRPDGKTVATRISLVSAKGREINVVPLVGKYIPKQGDSVIGIVVDYALTYWLLEINYVWKGRLDASEYLKRPLDPSKELPTDYLKVGDVVYTKVMYVERGLAPILSCRDSGYGKLEKGRLISINPAKVPRLIGAKGSMLETIKRITKAEVKVGTNGIIWVRAEKPEIEELVEQTIKRIEKLAHLQGLTKKIEDFLMKGMHKIQRGES